MGKNRSKRHRKGRGGRVTPKKAADALELLDGVTVNGQAFGVVSWWCDDPRCTEHQK